jgi:hypothetical protein
MLNKTFPIKTAKFVIRGRVSRLPQVINSTVDVLAFPLVFIL